MKRDILPSLDSHQGVPDHITNYSRQHQLDLVFLINTERQNVKEGSRKRGKTGKRMDKGREMR